MSERYVCPSCGHAVKIPPGQETDKCSCPRCSQVFIPAGDSSGQASASETQSSPGEVVNVGTAGPGDDIFQTTPTPPNTPEPLGSANGGEGILDGEGLLQPIEEVVDDRVNETPAEPERNEPDSTPDEATRELPDAGSQDDVFRLAEQDPPPRTDNSDVNADGIIDPMLSSDRLAPKVAKREGFHEQFVVTCTTCDTRIDVTREQIGETIKCPDCFMDVFVSEPKPKPKTTSVDIDNAEVFTFKDQADTKRLQQDEQNAQKRYASAALQSAARDLDDDPKSKRGFINDGYGLDQYTAEIKIFGVLGQPAVWPRWIVYSLGLAIVLALAGTANQYFYQDGFMQMLMALGSFVFASLVAMAWLVVVAPGLMVLFHTAGSGQDDIEGFQSGSPFDDMSGFFLLGWSVIVSGSTGGIVAALGTMLFIPTYIGAAITIICTCGLHPIVFLSLVHSQSMGVPFSNEVVATITSRRPQWMRFYGFVAAIAFISWIMVALVLSWGWYAALPAGLVITGCIFFYFRLLGRLAIECGLHHAEV